LYCCFFFSSRRRHTRFSRDWSSDVCSSDLETVSDKKVMSGGGKTLELYYMKGTSHNMYNLFVYLPQHKLAFWGDGYNPPEGNEEIGRASCRERVKGKWVEDEGTKKQQNIKT